MWERENRELIELLRREKKIVEGKKGERLTIGLLGHLKSNMTIFEKVKKLLWFHLLVFIRYFIRKK